MAAFEASERLAAVEVRSEQIEMRLPGAESCLSDLEKRSRAEIDHLLATVSDMKRTHAGIKALADGTNAFVDGVKAFLEALRH